MTITPIGKTLLVKPHGTSQKTTSGLILNTSDEKPQKGDVIELGVGAKNKDGSPFEFSIKTGDTVLFKKYSPEEVEVDGEKYLIVKLNDVIALT